MKKMYIRDSFNIVMKKFIYLENKGGIENIADFN